MLFFCRIAKYELRCLSNQSQRRHYRIPHACLVNCSSSLARNCYVENPAKSISKKLTELCNNARFFAAPVQMKPKKEDKDAGAPRLNDRIKAEIVRLVYPNKAHLIVSRNEALERARKLKLDLVEVQRNAKPPVCKIMDFHKEKYLQQIKEKDRAKGKADVAVRKGDCKEVRFTAKTEQKDLQMKADMVKRLMERGYRVKCMAMGTEDQDLGELLSRLSALIEDVAFVESGPRVEKKQAYAIVRHIKFGPSKKGAKKTFKAVDAATFNASSSNSTPGSAAESDGEIVFEEAESDSSSESSPDSWSVFDASDDFEKVFDLGDDPLPISSSPVDMETSSSSDRVKTVQSQQIEPTPPIGNRYQRSDLPNKPPHTKAMDFRSPFSESTPRPELRFANREGLVRRPGINGSPLVGGTTQVAGPRQGHSLPGDSGSKGYGIFSTSKVESPGERIPRSEYNRNREENPSTPDLRGSQRSGGQEKW